MTQLQDIQQSPTNQEFELQWTKENAKTKNTPIKKLHASSCLGLFTVSWDDTDSFATYDLFLDDEFVFSSTSLAEVKKEAVTYMENKIHYDQYLSNVSKK